MTMSHPYRSGNYLPQDTERSLEPCVCDGQVPEELKGGMYVRNGSNPLMTTINNKEGDTGVGLSNNGRSGNDADQRDYHWFDGDGMLTGVLFDADSGSISPLSFGDSTEGQKTAIVPYFVNKFVLTDLLLSQLSNSCRSTIASKERADDTVNHVHATKSIAQRRNEQPILPSIATLLGPITSLPRITITILRSLSLAVLSLPSQYPIKRISVANTSIFWHDGRVLAGCESGPLSWVRLPGLETVGWWGLEGDGMNVINGCDEGGTNESGEHDEKGLLKHSYQSEGTREIGLRENGGKLLGWVREWTTAHPKRDPITGELLLFHSSIIPPYLHYSVIPSSVENRGLLLDHHRDRESTNFKKRTNNQLASIRDDNKKGQMKLPFEQGSLETDYRWGVHESSGGQMKIIDPLFESKSTNGRKTPRILAAPVPISSPKMMHDFACSSTHTILLDMPLSLDPMNLLRLKPIVAFNPSSPSRFGVLPRYSPEKVKWFEAKSCIIFHTALAYDEYEFRNVGERATQTKAESVLDPRNLLPDGKTGRCWNPSHDVKEEVDVVVVAVNLVCCRLNSSTLIYAAGNLDVPKNQKLPHGVSETCQLYYYRFDLTKTSGSVAATPSHAFPLSSIPFEFPTVPLQHTMKSAQFVYGCTMKAGSFSAALGGAAKIDCLVKVNVRRLVQEGIAKNCSGEDAVDSRTVMDILRQQKDRKSGDNNISSNHEREDLKAEEEEEIEERIRIFEMPPMWFAQECSFVARSSPRGEDDGYLLTYVFDENQLDSFGHPKDDSRSELWIIDAWNMKKVVAKIKLPQRVPYGLHGNWFTKEEIKQQREVKSIRNQPTNSPPHVSEKLTSGVLPISSSPSSLPPLAGTEGDNSGFYGCSRTILGNSNKQQFEVKESFQKPQCDSIQPPPTTAIGAAFESIRRGLVAYLS